MTLPSQLTSPWIGWDGGVPVGVALGVGVGVWVAVASGVCVGVGDGEGVGLGVWPMGVAVSVGEGVGVGLGVWPIGVGEAVGVGLAVGDGEALAVGEGLGVGVSVGAVGVSYSSTLLLAASATWRVPRAASTAIPRGVHRLRANPTQVARPSGGKSPLPEHPVGYGARGQRAVVLQHPEVVGVGHIEVA